MAWTSLPPLPCEVGTPAASEAGAEALAEADVDVDVEVEAPPLKGSTEPPALGRGEAGACCGPAGRCGPAG